MSNSNLEMWDFIPQFVGFFPTICGIVGLELGRATKRRILLFTMEKTTPTPIGKREKRKEVGKIGRGAAFFLYISKNIYRRGGG